MQLPYSDELNIGYLSKLFDKTTNCYKFFWFQAILRKMDGMHCSFTFDELINEMIADAWYMVTEYHLRLGPIGIKDNLEEVVKYIHTNYGFPSAEKRDKILAFLKNTDDTEILKYKSKLTQHVPYRLQSPFYDEIHINQKLWNKAGQELINEINEQRRLIYYFSGACDLKTEIRVSGLWAEYLWRHKEILKGWTQLHLINYLQKKNPSVPGIADKIERQEHRDSIERVRKYWKLIIQIDPTLKDIYGKVTLAQLDESISIDHFVPWQYVAHDELWNLHPTKKSINSSKSNSLPSWKDYFSPLGELEYRAYELKNSNEHVAEEFDKIAAYHLNNQKVRSQLYEDDLKKEDFIIRLEHVIKPVYESAQMSGFQKWVYKGEKSCGR